MGQILNSLIKPKNLQMFSVQLWYNQWVIPFLFKGDSHGSSSLFEKLAFLRLFGAIGYIFKLANNTKTLKHQCSKQPYESIDHGKVTTRRLDKAAFTATDTGLTSAALVGYFILNAAWVSPLFIAMSTTYLAKAIYSLGKNTHQLQQFKTKIDQRYPAHKRSISKLLCGRHYLDSIPEYNAKKQPAPTQEQIDKAKLERLRYKIKKSAVDVGSTILLLACSILWASNPILAVAGFIVFGMAYFLYRKRLSRKSKAKKQKVLELMNIKQSVERFGRFLKEACQDTFENARGSPLRHENQEALAEKIIARKRAKATCRFFQARPTRASQLQYAPQRIAG